MADSGFTDWITAISTAVTALALVVPWFRRRIDTYQLLPFGWRPPLLLLKDAALIVSERNPERADLFRTRTAGDTKDDPKLGIAFDIFRFAVQGGVHLYGKRPGSRIPVRAGLRARRSGAAND